MSSSYGTISGWKGWEESPAEKAAREKREKEWVIDEMTPGGWRSYRRVSELPKTQQQLMEEEQQREQYAALKAASQRFLSMTYGASVVRGGSTVWDGGMLALPRSDIDLFITLPQEIVDRIPSTICAVRDIGRLLGQDTGRPINYVSAPTGHWALTGREPKQAQVLRGSMIEFAPVPGNAESSAIRRAALKILGITLCDVGPDVDETHVLRSKQALGNAYNWVEARAGAWDHDALRDLAKRLRVAMNSRRDVREVL